MLSIRGIRWSGKKGKPVKLLPTGPIVDAFKEYINNELPTRFIDTSTLQFISRKDLFPIFQDEIASVTEEQIQERIKSFRSDPFATYEPRRATVLRQIIQEIVQYVILSHRWDDITGEPTSQDLSGGKRHVARFKKLSQFCKTSNKLGYKLAWVDTCCIDKSNAAELSEAIHAMYKWYANAYLCIVYLAESTSYEDWVTDSWFTRGWTLQELLAPKRLKFYDKNWRQFVPAGIDDDRKSDAILHLQKITGIREAVLAADNSHGVHGRSFWEIMSWASKRRTTRTEDKAYCLIGLFRISLTIAYGEGHQAFSRLVEAVSEKNPSWDLFAWCGQPSLYHFALPYSPASYSVFETCIGKDRIGVQDFTITKYGLSMKSLPPIPIELSSIVAPEGHRKPFLVNLKPRYDAKSPRRYSNLVIGCGATRLNTIREARQLAVCIINHHGTRSRKQGKLLVGKEYICFLLYSEEGEDDETTWMKLTTDSQLRISCLGPETASGDTVVRATDGITLPLVTTFIRSSKSSTW
ncbi:heterokaryon incompatibility protein-domain-containing protein [Boletus edulis]|nr:heterokaryon incompatibility protein-domain-containing protein [Boletus edulis]